MRGLVLACLLNLVWPAAALAADGGSEGSAQPSGGPRCGALQDIKDFAKQQYNEEVTFDREDDRGTRLIILSSDKTFTALRASLDYKIACILTTDPQPPEEDGNGGGPGRLLEQHI